MGSGPTKLSINYRASGVRDPRFTKAQNGYPVVPVLPGFACRQAEVDTALNKYTCTVTLDDSNHTFKVEQACIGPGKSGALVKYTMKYEGEILDVVDYFGADRVFSTTRHELLTSSITYEDTSDGDKQDQIFRIKVSLDEDAVMEDFYDLNDANIAVVPPEQMKWQLAVHQKDNSVSADDVRMMCFEDNEVWFSSMDNEQIPWALFKSSQKSGLFSWSGTDA